MSRIGGAPAAGLFQDLLLAILLIVCTVAAGVLWALSIILQACRAALGLITGRPGDYSLLWWSVVMACAFAAGVLALTPPSEPSADAWSLPSCPRLPSASASVPQPARQRLPFFPPRVHAKQGAHVVHISTQWSL